jgi:hypothetical protein
MRKWILGLAFAAAIPAGGFSANAQTMQPMCFSQFIDCEVSAAQEDSFWYRTVQALECELAFWDCFRTELLD